MERIKVMIVDDSALVRQVITQSLSRDASIEVLATAQDPVFALEKLKTLSPDVLIVDIEMPRMDGLTFLRKIMAEQPTPVIICSSLAEKGTLVTVEALAAGAVSVINNTNSSPPKRAQLSIVRLLDINVFATSFRAASPA